MDKNQGLLGRRVRLKQAYRPDMYHLDRDKDWIGFEFGFVVEIVSTDQRSRQVTNVSLNLFDREGRLYLAGSRTDVAGTIPVPTFVDFSIDEFEICNDQMQWEAGMAQIPPPLRDATPCAIGDLRLGGNTSKEGCMATICAVVGEDEYQHLRVTRAQLENFGESIDSFLSYTEPEASE
jgi:hypothetical protein